MIICRAKAALALPTFPPLYFLQQPTNPRNLLRNRVFVIFMDEWLIAALGLQITGLANRLNASVWALYKMAPLR